MTDMKYAVAPGRRHRLVLGHVLPARRRSLDILVTTLAIIGFVASIVRRHLAGAWLGHHAAWRSPRSCSWPRTRLPVIGLLWNPRLLPFLYLLRYLLMMVGIVELVELRRRAGTRPTRLAAQHRGRCGLGDGRRRSASSCSIDGLFLFQQVPGGKYDHRSTASRCTPGARRLQPDHADADRQGRAERRLDAVQLQGYEGRDAYPEYKALIDQMAASARPTTAAAGRCGRTTSDNGQYGTTMALMLLPHWTDGCIAVMEGLFFEASGTTPYHFLTAAAMSAATARTRCASCATTTTTTPRACRTCRRSASAT